MKRLVALGQHKFIVTEATEVRWDEICKLICHRQPSIVCYKVCQPISDAESCFEAVGIKVVTP